jgi:hypothetical protein
MWVFTGCDTLPEARPEAAPKPQPQVSVPVPMPDMIPEAKAFMQEPSRVSVPGMPEPPDIFLNGPVPFTSATICNLKTMLQVGRSDMYTVVYAYLREGQGMIYAMITQLAPPLGDWISEAWVDVDGDGLYDLYFEGEDALREAYPSPCDILGLPV